MRAVFYGLCTRCKRWPDFDARASARISAGDARFGHSVELASDRPASLERAEFLAQFSGPTQDFLRERVTFPERYGLDWCGCCLSRPMAAFGILNSGIPEADGLCTMFLYALCSACALGDGDVRMEAKIQSRIAARAIQ
jgi:hypothetical protein